MIDFLVQSESQPEFHHQAVKLLNHASNQKQALFLPETCLAEVVYVLSSTRGRFGFERQQVAAVLMSFLAEYPIKMHDKKVMIDALTVYSANSKLDFADCVIVADRRRGKNKVVYSRDTDFDGFEHLQRVAPDIILKHKAG